MLNPFVLKSEKVFYPHVPNLIVSHVSCKYFILGVEDGGKQDDDSEMQAEEDPPPKKKKLSPPPKRKAFRSPITDIFSGAYQNETTCSECGHVSKVLNSFQDLSLPIPTSDMVMFEAFS